jgi:hypothetical protein
VITIKGHTPQFINDTHRTRYYYGKCVDCLVIYERAYCIDDAEFMHNCNCGGSAAAIILVRVEAI